MTVVRHFYFKLGPTLPVHIAYHCITMVNDKIMMIGGYIDEDSGFSERTFSIDFDNLEGGTWTDGPSMKNYRHSLISTISIFAIFDLSYFPPH